MRLFSARVVVVMFIFDAVATLSDSVITSQIRNSVHKLSDVEQALMLKAQQLRAHATTPTSAPATTAAIAAAATGATDGAAAAAMQALERSLSGAEHMSRSLPLPLPRLLAGTQTGTVSAAADDLFLLGERDERTMRSFDMLVRHMCVLCLRMLRKVYLRVLRGCDVCVAGDGFAPGLWTVQSGKRALWHV